MIALANTPSAICKRMPVSAQADAYGGYNKLYEGRQPGVAGSGSGVLGPPAAGSSSGRSGDQRRQHKQGPGGHLADRVGGGPSHRRLFDIDRQINGQDAARRKAVRHELSAPLATELEAWIRQERARLSRHNDVAQAMGYMLKRWPAFTRFLNDGRICLSNNAAEQRVAVPSEDGHGYSPVPIAAAISPGVRITLS